MTARNAIVLFSGGPDSTAAALWAADHHLSPELLTFKFRDSQEQNGELATARKVADMLGLSLTVIDFSSAMNTFPIWVHPLMHAGTPKDHANDLSGSLLPFGAGIVLSFAASYALSKGLNQVIWGATADDGYGNLDYSQTFADDLSGLISKVVGCALKISVPFTSKHKFQIMEAYKGREDLFAATWSCKTMGAMQCGSCKACLARRFSTVLAKLSDHSPYTSEPTAHSFTEQELADPLLLSREKLASLFTSPQPSRAS